MAIQRNSRQRKKMHLAEFQELGFLVKFNLVRKQWFTKRTSKRIIRYLVGFPSRSLIKYFHLERSIFAKVLQKLTACLY